MLRLSAVGPRWRTFYVLTGVFLCLISCLNISAQSALPEGAPVLISQPDSTRALVTIPSGKRGATTPVTVVQPGGRTLITVYVTNLSDLLEGEGANAFRADVEDVRHFRYPLEIVSFQQTPERKWVYALTVRLHDQLADVGDVLMRVTWRGMSSNRVRLAVGHEGSKIQDDPGSTPTPMPDAPVRIGSTSSAIGASLPYDRLRLMEQATFGPSRATDFRMRQIGISRWLDEQMTEKRNSSGAIRYYSVFPYPNLPPQATTPNPTNCGVGSVCFRDNYTMYPLQNWFYQEALYGEDQQVRRRVSWALSQIWVVSGRDVIQGSQMLPYIQTLDENAFENYRVLMERMTLNAAMGQYLDMAINTAQNPNENYAREILQLFTIGLFMLNQDGTLQRDNQGNPIPTYDQNIVNNFTKVFTGWSYCQNPAFCPKWESGKVNYSDPLLLFPENHDTSSKTLLNGQVIPAGQPAGEDLKLALDNIYYHPNVAPFVSKLLIQQLVTSNPTPAYVGRVSAVFRNNGFGMRGDMKAVVKAILLDPEARGNIKTDPDYGKLREPVLYTTNILRPYNPTANSNLTPPASCNGLSDGVINGITLTLDQDTLSPPTVFNYYPMDYVLPNTNLSAPEFGIFSTGTALKRPNFVNQMVSPGTAANVQIGILINAAQGIPCGTKIDLSRFQALVQADPSGVTLVDALNNEMMHGSMSQQMRTQILNAVQAITVADNGLKKTRTAVYLVATSPQFQVQR